MPTFFSRVFSRKDKDKKKDAEEKDKDRLPSPTSPTNKRLSSLSQQEGRQPAEPIKEKEDDKDKDKFGLALFRPKSQHAKTASTSSAPARNAPTKRADDFPQLKLDLNLPGLKNGSAQQETSGIGLGFGSTEGDSDLRTMFVDSVVAGIQLDDATLGETRLSPSEALVLMSACAKVITERGA